VTKTKNAKISDLVRVESISQLDHPTPGRWADLVVLGTGEKVSWLISSDSEWYVDAYAPFAVGDELAIDSAFVTADGRLRRVRYSCKGRSFRGVAFHEKRAK